MISCILLCAGESSRFGSPKALANLSSKCVIESLEETLISSFVDEVIVVLGAFAEDVKPFILKHRKVKAVYNKDYNFGQTSSLKVGLDSLSPQTKGFFVLPVDFPLVKTETLNSLREHFLKEYPLILIPTYKDQKGHPPLFSAELKKEILELKDNVGLNTVAKGHAEDTCLYPVCDQGVVLSFNTIEEFEKLKSFI